MSRPPGPRWVSALAVAAMAAAPCAAAVDPPAPVATTAHFAFHSDFATNLNDALIVAGTARNRGVSELFHGDTEVGACFAELPSSARAGWDLAVDYYAQVISPNSWLSRQQYLLRADLSGLGDDLDDRAERFVEIARGFWTTAAPAYEACRWPAQDETNRRWIERLMPRLEAHEAALTARLEDVYQMPWHGLPIRVDVVAHAPPYGANTIARPPHIVVGSSNTDEDALEIVHHEASHTLTGRGSPLQESLADAARELDVELPDDLWHVVLFYATGEVVRRHLEATGEPGYTPYMERHNLWRGRWGEYREAIEATWTAYLAGDTDMPETAAELVTALHRDPAVGQ